MENYIVLDIETQKVAQEVEGGWNNIPAFGLAIAVIQEVSNNGIITYHYHDTRAALEVTRRNNYKGFYDLLTSQQLIEDLLDAQIIVTFNGIRFDYEVLRPYGLEPEKLYPKSFDILVEMQKVLRHRVSLDSVAKATLGEGKSGDGTQAVQWYKAGKIDKVIEYCYHDVEITRRIYEFIKKHGYIHYLSLQGEVRTCRMNQETA